MNKLLLSLGLLTLSLSTLANEKIYQCTSSGEIEGGQIKQASITFSEGKEDSIDNAVLAVLSERGGRLDVTFRAPLKLGYGKNGKAIFLEGQNNSRLFPRLNGNHADFIIFNNLKEKINFSDLPSTLENLEYQAHSGYGGNRGSYLYFSLDCTKKIKEH